MHAKSPINLTSPINPIRALNPKPYKSPINPTKPKQFRNSPFGSTAPPAWVQHILGDSGQVVRGQCHEDRPRRDALAPGTLNVGGLIIRIGF